MSLAMDDVFVNVIHTQATQVLHAIVSTASRAGVLARVGLGTFTVPRRGQCTLRRHTHEPTFSRCPDSRAPEIRKTLWEPF